MGEKISIIKLQDRDVLALSGIGHPEAFEDDLKKEFHSVVPFRFLDHHAYTLHDVQRIVKAAKDRQAGVITTEKDWIKLASLWPEPDEVLLGVRRIGVKFEESDEKIWKKFIQQVESAC